MEAANEMDGIHDEYLDYKGELFGFKIEAKEYEFAGKVHKHTVVSVYVEDDGHWHKQMTFDSFWSKDLLKTAQKLVEISDQPNNQ